METINRIFDINQFSAQLTKIRLYRDYKHQNNVAVKMKIARQVFSLWELGKRLPTLPQLTELANFFHVNVEYFFRPGSEPQDFDLSIIPLIDKGSYI